MRVKAHKMSREREIDSAVSAHGGQIGHEVKRQERTNKASGKKESICEVRGDGGSGAGQKSSWKKVVHVQCCREAKQTRQEPKDFSNEGPLMTM